MMVTDQRRSANFDVLRAPTIEIVEQLKRSAVLSFGLNSPRQRNVQGSSR